MIHDFDKAEDIAQKTIVNLWKKKEQIKPDQNIFNYLMTAAHNNCLNFIRDEGRRHKKHEAASEEIDKMHMPDYTAEQELLLKVNQILDQESEERQTIFRLNRFEGFTFVEISKRLDIPLNKVKYNVAMVMEKMYEHLGDYLTILILILINVLLFSPKFILLV